MMLDSKKTAMLTLDFQKWILGMSAGADSIIPNAKKAVLIPTKKLIVF